jgi:murein DD-endopeptidase MepM/ murein hydrolase activator NlpD
MKSRNLLRAICLLALLASFIPAGKASALVPTAVPPVDMFQLPWEQGLSWVAIDGLDNGTKRPLSSSHNFTVGGAIDFAPHNNMVRGENTSTFWTAAAAAGTVVGTSSCHVILDHGNGWITQYQFLANVQVKLGDAVSRNQRLGIIADGVRQKFCPGSVEPNVPHLHFMLRPTMRDATFAGWQVNYLPVLNKTTFTKNGETLGLFKPLLNAPIVPPTATPTSTIPATITPGPGTVTLTPSVTPFPPTSTLPASTTGTPATASATQTSTPTTTGAYVSTVISQPNIGVGDTTLATVNLNNVPTEGYTSAEFTCTFDANLVETSSIVITSLFGPDSVSIINVPQNGTFIVAIASSDSNKATTSGAAFTFDVKGLQAGQTTVDCVARVSQGNNTLTTLPSSGSAVTILDATLTPTVLPPTATPTSIFTATPTVPTQTPIAGWSTFTNSTFGFQFQYPPEGQIVAGNTDNFARINLPFAQGTNLGEKYLQVDVVENANPCRSPVAASSIVQSSETVMLNGITFLKETGQEPAAGNLYQFVAYSTARDNACVSLSFVLHSVNPGNLATPIPVFDYAAESAVFEQIVATYTWLALAPTATPTFTSIPVESPTPTFTATPVESATPIFTPTSIISPTATPITGAVLTGQVIAAKVVTVRLYDTEDAFVAAVNANPDGTFRFDVAAGTYTIVATANGFLRIQGSITLAEGDVRAMPVITLLAGDIDDNNEIDQFDAMTIGFNYNTTEPPGADLNNDGIINVLDLELLAKNYRRTGPVVWE